jgi:tungstate transport system ATP-binding protein
MSVIQIKNICKQFEKNEDSTQTVLSNINFSVKRGECFTVIGPNGSGKSTLLNIIGLLIPPTSGSVIYKGKNITDLPKNEKVKVRRNFSFVRQKPIVLDTTVFKNIAYGLEVRKFKKSKIRRRVNGIIDEIGLKGFENKNARSLSGGEMQRVAIAMNFVLDPEIYFLDEVSANLDPKNVSLLEDFINDLKRKNKTIIMSTHDRMEAIKFSDRIAVLNDGKISQIGKINDVFTSPKDEYTAVFVGYENVFSGLAEYNDELGLTEIRIDDLVLNASDRKAGIVKILIRPESIGLSLEVSSKTSYQNSILGEIKQIRKLGNTYHLVVKSKSVEFLTSITRLSFNNLHLDIGKNVYLNFKATDIKLL